MSDWLEGQRRLLDNNSSKPAVVGPNTRLSREQFEHRIRHLAGRLQGQGVSAGDCVAVCLDRSPDFIVAFVALLRLGACCMPVDPAYPAARILKMLENRSSTVVTSSDLLAGLPQAGLMLLRIEELGDDHHETHETLDAIAGVSDEWPAYTMFTSGTTAEPRPVTVSRGALASYLESLKKVLALSADDVFLHSASFAFSASIRQVFAPLTSGACLVVAGEDERRDPFLLLELMEQECISVWDTVPSVWQSVEQVLQRAGAADRRVGVPSSLRLVLLTGEPLAWGLVAAWREHLRASVAILNLYSQTELAGTVAAYPVPDGPVPAAGHVPLGEALPDVTLFVLDEELNPVQPGGAGEVYVASKRITRGSDSIDAETAGSLLEALEAKPGYRQITRTGDRVRLDPGGALVPAGRTDHLVKLRGFRIDLLEIESELVRDERISQAVAVVESSTRLVAYVVPVSGAPDVSSVLEPLRKRLPPYAVPGRVVVLDRLPVTASGKVDRSALAGRRVDGADNAGRDPGDPTEKKLLKIWENVLEYRDATLEDNFFDKGGDSLTSVSLFLEIEERFGIRLPPATLLTEATVGGLARVIRETPPSKPVPQVLELRASGSLPPLFLVHAIWEHVPHFRKLVELLDPELPVYALEPIRSAEATSGPGLDVARLVRHYAREIRKHYPEGPYFLGGWSIGGFMAFGVAVEMESRGDRPLELLLIDSSSPSLRPEKRPVLKRGMAGRVAYLNILLRRQVKSFSLPLGEQWERMVWMGRELRRRIRESMQDSGKRRMQERLRAQMQRAFDQYQPPPYHGSAVLFRSEQPMVDPERDADLGWKQHVLGELEVIALPGDHVTVVIEPNNMRLLAGSISQCVNHRAQLAQAANSQAGGDNPIDVFLEATTRLQGSEYFERVPWVNTVTRDAIRHLAFGICDDNPLWLDESYADRSGKPLPAPPVFLVAARYPVLHGAPLDLPLISLLQEVEYRWAKPLYEGEKLHSVMTQGDVHEQTDSSGNRRVYVTAHARYENAAGDLLGEGKSIVVRMLSQGRMQVDNWSTHRYTQKELDEIGRAIESETRTGSRRLAKEEFDVGTRLPPIVRGPLTIGDMVCWHTAIGPSYRPGPLGYKDANAAPQFRVYNPVTGWPVKYTLQHEDTNLAHQRGMPAPFDNGVMRLGWVSPLITNWMGDDGFLARLRVVVNLPFFYGDTCWYTGEVTERVKEGDRWRVHVAIKGSNQHGAVITTGDADVLLPGPSS